MKDIEKLKAKKEKDYDGDIKALIKRFDKMDKAVADTVKTEVGKEMEKRVPPPPVDDDDDKAPSGATVKKTVKKKKTTKRKKKA